MGGVEKMLGMADMKVKKKRRSKGASCVMMVRNEGASWGAAFGAARPFVRTLVVLNPPGPKEAVNTIPNHIKFMFN